MTCDDQQRSCRARIRRYAPAFAFTGGFALVGQTTSLTRVPLQGGTGTFTFTDIPLGLVHACSIGGESNLAFIVASCSASSSGSYASIVCGGGNVTAGAATLTTGVGGTPIVTISYGITFVAGVGVLQGTEAQGGTVLAPVDILPTGGDCASGVTQFTATVAGVDA